MMLVNRMAGVKESDLRVKRVQRNEDEDTAKCSVPSDTEEVR